MGITVKHVVVAALIFALVGFVYVIGFSEIDRVRSPRARAMDARPSVSRLVANVRQGMANGQGRVARTAGDELIVHFPNDPNAWLYRGYAYRYRSWDMDRTIERSSWEQLLRIVEGWDFEVMGAASLSSSHYMRGWALRGLGRVEESRADFREVALMAEAATGRAVGVGSGDPAEEALVSGLATGAAYNLACYWAVAGETERALGYWRMCVDSGYDLNTGGGWWRVDPDFEDLWDETEFWEIAGDWDRAGSFPPEVDEDILHWELMDRDDEP